MMAGAAERAASVLHALADLSPSSAEQHLRGRTIPLEWFRWLPVFGVQLLRTVLAPAGEVVAVPIDRGLGERLAAVDQIRPEQRSLRVGWLFVAGGAGNDEGRRVRVFHPLVTMPVRVQRTIIGGAALHPAGDPEVTELVADPATRHALEAHIEVGGGGLDTVADAAIDPALLARFDRLRRFAQAAAEAAGFGVRRLVPADAGPEELLRADGLVIVAGVGVYAVHETGGLNRASSLRALAAAPLDRWTSLHTIYLDASEVDRPGQPEPAPDPDQRVESPYLLTPTQREAVIRSRSEPVTVLRGAPGTGKSHTVAAIASDALSRGQRVLVAAKSDATVDALLELFQRAPGTDPVVFGSSERRQLLAERLAAGALQPASEKTVADAKANLDAAIARRDVLRDAIERQLRAEMLMRDPTGEDRARSTAPRLFDIDADLTLAARLAQQAIAPGTGWWRGRRRRKARRRLEAISGAHPGVDISAILHALELASTRRTATELVAGGGLRIGANWDELAVADAEVRGLVALWVSEQCRGPDRLNRATRPALSAIATALRSGRAARRTQLARLDDRVTRALPLWVGTLADIDDLLPPVPALFDLVILDEASSIDQPLAAPALLRGRRAVVVGDPQQLRHVSFLSDARLEEVLCAYGLDDDPLLAARLDARRNSTFDVAAAAAPVLTLGEHFRSAPHLVDFVTRRLYHGEVQIATRSPLTESVDCIRVVRLEGRRDKAGVVRAEVQWIVRELKALRQAGATSVGVVTPFRAQADAIETAVLGAFSADDLEALDLRVGTVHAFQGNERNVIIASLGIGPDDGAGSWRFVEDPHLFAVFLTRAREHLTFVLSADPPPEGLVAAYLAQGDSPPPRPEPVRPVDPWVSAIASDLASAGLHVTTAYPTGRHLVDVCVGVEGAAVALECTVHDNGPEAHVERHLSLHRAGWRLLEAHRSRWTERRAELVVELLARIGGPAG